MGSLSGKYTDPIYGSDLFFGCCSHWIYPSRAYLETQPASVFLNGVGINIANTIPNPMVVAQMLAKYGFTKARIEINWVSLDYTTLALSDTAAGIPQLKACAAFGIRPLILLNANQGVPCPYLSLSHTVAVPAPIGSTTVTLDSVTGIVIGLSGFSDLTGYTMNEVLVTAISGNMVTLSKPLPVAFTLNQVVPMNTFKYRPFDVVGDPYYNATEQAATLAGWNTYVTTVAQKAVGIVGVGGFDLEVWNEITFGSQFLLLPNYYGAQQTGIPNLVTATANVAISNPSLFSGVIIEDGLFSNESPFAAASTEPARIGALGKHPYPLAISYPSGQQGNTSGSGFFMLDANLQYESPVYSWLPTYNEYMPEYYAMCLQTETITRDLSPITINGHGRFARVGNPCPVFVTEIGINPSYVGISDLNTALLLKAKGSMRLLCFLLNKGAAIVHLFSTSDGGGDYGFELVLDRFMTDIVTPRNPYPNPDSGYVSPALRCISNIVAKMSANVATISTSRQLSVLGISDTHDNYQFLGDGSAAHPNGYDREAFQFLPFQINDNRFVIPYYVMTRNLVNALTPEKFNVQIGGVKGTSISVSAYDPLNDTSVPLGIVSSDNSFVTLNLTAADYPYLLIIDDGTPTQILPGPGTGTIGRLIDVLTELYSQQSNLTLIDSSGARHSLYSLIKGPIFPTGMYAMVEFKSGPKTISLLLANGKRSFPPLYTVASPWHG